jgi:ribonuclease BN (tRNA processing enzyme)
MWLTIAGSGDAFDSGGRLNTCFWLETANGTLLIDCGVSALSALKVRPLAPNRIGAIILSHRHGDHFAELPFLLLDGQFLARRERPLLIAAPPGTRVPLDAALEMLFPKFTGSKWRYTCQVVEVAPDIQADMLGHSLLAAEVIHQSGAPSIALRLSDGKKVFAYSGDTERTDALSPPRQAPICSFASAMPMPAKYRPHELGNSQIQAS